MPNGHREPYRLRPDYDPPSPAHTSDTEDTWEDKLRWRLIARRVLRRWRLLVRRAALARAVKFIERMVWRHEPRMLPLARHIAEFLVA